MPQKAFRFDKPQAARRGLGTLLLVFLGVVLALLLVVALGHAQSTTRKLWVSKQYEERATSPGTEAPVHQFFFIEDMETGTRCYAITSSYHDGDAIACVPRIK